MAQGSKKGEAVGSDKTRLELNSEPKRDGRVEARASLDPFNGLTVERDGKMARSWICITVIRAAGKGRRDKDGLYRNSIGEHRVGGGFAQS